MSGEDRVQLGVKLRQFASQWMKFVSDKCERGRGLRPRYLCLCTSSRGWLGSRVVSVLDSGAEGPGFKSQSRRCWVAVLGKLFTPIVPLFTKQQNW